MHELAPGLWWWEARHPQWTAEDDAADHGWGPEVSSYAVDDGTQLLLIDPTLPPAAVADVAAVREVVVVLTCPWHERDARELAQRFAAAMFSPPHDAPRDDPLQMETYVAGDRLPGGIEVFPGSEPNDLVLWIAGCRAVTAGDTLIDRGSGVELPVDWASRHGDPTAIAASLRPLLDLPVEHVLPTHGPPSDRAALERALAAVG